MLTARSRLLPQRPLLMLFMSTLASVPTARAEPFDYATTPTHTFVHFEVLHAGLSTRRGRFNRAEGRITLDRAARSGNIEFTVQIASIDSGDSALDARLREAMGSNLPASGPTSARFTSSELAFEGDKPRSARGLLSWRGQSLPLEVTAEHFNCYFNPLFRREVCGGEFIAEIEPARWGLVLDPALGWAPTLKLRVQVEAVRQ